MKRRITTVVAAIVVAVMMMCTLSSCFYANNTTETQVQTTIASPDFVRPADAAGKIDLKKEDPSNDKISFTFDEEGRVSECEYKSGEVSYYVGYTYRDGEVDVSAFATDKDGNAFLMESRTYKVAAFDKAAGFVEKDGFFFNGFNSFEEIARETKSEKETAAGDKKDESGSADSSKDTEKAPADNDTSDTTADTEKKD